jgi:hypothetical protein
MKTVNKNNVCDAFHDELQQIENYIKSAMLFLRKKICSYHLAMRMQY